MDFRIGYRRPLRTATLLRKKRQRTRLCLGALIGIAVTVTACTWEPGAPDTARTTSAAPTLHVALTSTAPPAANASRRIYPYSIVPGGVASREDIARRVATDKVVASHYASFDVRKAHAVTVSKPRAVHVSYRKGDKVYWTANKVMLAQGETLLSDGTHDIRGRCGNRISDTAMLPVAMDEPTAAELDESMNVASEDADDGSLQNASFGLDDAMGGNPASFQRFASFNTPLGNAPAAPPTRWGMPSVPMSPPSAMGLEPARYLAGTSAPPAVLQSGNPAPVAATPQTPAAVPVPVTSTSAPDVPLSVPTPADAPGMPAPPVITHGPVTPVTPVTPVKVPLPEGEVPEPGTLWLFGAAFALLLLVTRKARRAA
jgi:hypothetical protein